MASKVQSPWLSVTEGAAYLRMRRNEFDKLVKAGSVGSWRRGKTIFVDARELDELMRQNPSGMSAPAAALLRVS